jgi:hypothetical protein
MAVKLRVDMLVLVITSRDMGSDNMSVNCEGVVEGLDINSKVLRISIGVSSLNCVWSSFK